MAELSVKTELSALFTLIEDSNRQIKQQLASLELVQLHVNDVPQYARGEELPELIPVTSKYMGLETALSQGIDPQSVHQYNHNMPKRFEGIIQLVATKEQYQAIDKLIYQNTKLRKALVAGLKEAEPESRKRSALTRSLFPDILFQTLHRKIPLLNYDAQSITTSWCEDQVGMKKLETQEVDHLVEKWCATVDLWRANQMRRTVRDVDNVFKKTAIRVHPQAVVKSIRDNGKAKYDTYKVHSPLIVLSPSQTPIRYVPLNDFVKVQKNHEVLKGYKQLIDGSCLYHKCVTAINR